MLRRYYLKEGYADFQVKSTVAEMTRDKKNFFITFSVDEGEKYKFGDVKVQTKNEALNKQTLDEIISPLKGLQYKMNLVLASQLLNICWVLFVERKLTIY